MNKAEKPEGIVIEKLAALDYFVSDLITDIINKVYNCGDMR